MHVIDINIDTTHPRLRLNSHLPTFDDFPLLIVLLLLACFPSSFGMGGMRPMVHDTSRCRRSFIPTASCAALEIARQISVAPTHTLNINYRGRYGNNNVDWADGAEPPRGQHAPKFSKHMSTRLLVVQLRAKAILFWFLSMQEQCKLPPVSSLTCEK